MVLSSNLLVSIANDSHRRHHARHVKPFKCMEAMIIPPHLQTSSRHQAQRETPALPSSHAERSRCDKAFATKNELERHRKSVHYCIPEVGPREWYRCPIAGCKVGERLWPRRDNLLVHMKQAHPKSVGAELWLVSSYSVACCMLQTILTMEAVCSDQRATAY